MSVRETRAHLQERELQCQFLVPQASLRRVYVMVVNPKKRRRRFLFSCSQGRIPDHHIQRELSEMNSNMLSRISNALITLALLNFSPTFLAAPAPEPNIGVNGYFSTDRVQRGHPVQAAIVLDIPAGYHVNGNRPL